jgi:polyisoprenoid-binding protein YceI
MSVTGVLVILAVGVLYSRSNQASASTGGSSTTKNQWYEKDALTVEPAEGVKGPSGSLLVLQADSAVYIDGNSTLHHYQMNANALKGSAVIKGSAKDLLKSLQKGKVGVMSLVVPVESFKSKDKGLDKNAYVALKLKENPEIEFDLVSEKLATGKEANTYVMTAQGKLTVAGVAVPIVLTANTTFKEGQVRIQGVQKLKFTDFKITPPKASILFVTVTCTDEFDLYYDVTFSAQSDVSKKKTS